MSSKWRLEYATADGKTWVTRAPLNHTETGRRVIDLLRHRSHGRHAVRIHVLPWVKTSNPMKIGA